MIQTLNRNIPFEDYKNRKVGDGLQDVKKTIQIMKRGILK